MPINLRHWDDPPNWDDDEAAARWRGPIFYRWNLDFHWCEGSSEPPEEWKKLGVGKFKRAAWIERPGSVTFPICYMCGRLVWSWPHFEEEVPEKAVCEACFDDEVKRQKDEDDYYGR